MLNELQHFNIKYVRDLNKQQYADILTLRASMSKKTIYLTPTQVIEKYPELEGFGWSAKEIGMFLKSRLLDGYYNHSLRKSMIEEDSIGKLVDFANDLIEMQKVKTVFPIKRESKVN